MNILITGASGFLGRNISELLLSAGHKVTNFSHGPFGDPRVEDILFDAFQDSATDLLKGRDFDAVLHLAAFASPRLAKDYEKTIELNVNLTEEMLQIAAGFPSLKKFVFFSSATTYADSATRPLREDAPQAAKENDYYAFSKIKAEHHCLEHREQGLPVSIWRLTNCFGPYQSFRPTPNLIPQIMVEALEEGKVTILNGDYSRDFLYSRDLARIFLEGLEKEFPPIVNIATGMPHTVGEIAEFVGKKLGIPVEDKQEKIAKAMDLTLDISEFRQLYPHFEFTDFLRALEETLAYYSSVLNKP